MTFDKTKPRVLIVGNFLSGVVGNRGVCEDLAVQLDSSGYQVLTTSFRRGRVDRLVDMTSTCWRYRRHYDVAQIDVYSGPSFFWAEAVCWSLRRMRKPYVLTLHGGELPRFSAKWPRRVRRLLGSAAVVTAPSRYLQEGLRLFRPDIMLLPNALNCGHYRFRLRSNIKPCLMWLRAFHSVYNPSMAVDVAGLLRRTFPSLTLSMAGPDKHDGSLQRVIDLSHSLGLESTIHLAGRISKEAIPEFIDSGDIFLNTTNADNTPVSVLEAMAGGACVVSTNVGGLKFLLSHEQNALLVEPNNPHAMAAAVERLLNDPMLASALSEQARRTAESFDWSRIRPAWERILRQVAAQTTPRVPLLAPISSHQQ